MRLIFSLLTFSAFAYGGWYVWENVPQVKPIVLAKMADHNIQTGLQTLEVRYPADEIMRQNTEHFIKSSDHKFLEPQLHYFPYLLMDVKYSKERAKTQEGIVLWSLNDGEMVVNTKTWEKTHGFEDCLLAKADRNDFKVLTTLIEGGGALDRERLYEHFQIDTDMVDDWIESCREKKLIVVSGNQFRLHFEKPRLHVEPITHFDLAIVAKQLDRGATKAKKHYSHGQIKKFAQVAFGRDFAIRRAEEIFLPVYSIVVQNPDGSQRTHYFNAVNGSRLESL